MVEAITVMLVDPPKSVVAILVPVVVPTVSVVEKVPEEVKATVAVPPPLSILTVTSPE